MGILLIKNHILKDLLSGDSDDRFHVIEENDWEGSDKYQDKTVYFEDTTTGKFYVISDRRSGSYYSDYWHESDDWANEGEQKIDEVIKHEIVITTHEWIYVKDDSDSTIVPLTIVV